MAEVEVESVAFIVCDAIGLDSGDYSFAYVARWAEGSTDLLKETGERVMACAREIKSSSSRRATMPWRRKAARAAGLSRRHVRPAAPPRNRTPARPWMLACLRHRLRFVTDGGLVTRRQNGKVPEAPGTGGKQ